MKKSLLLISAFVLCHNSFGQSSGVLPDLNPFPNATKNLDFFIPIENVEKNNSYDGPLSIDEYNVSGGTPTLAYTHEFTYTPAGVLVSVTKYDSGMVPIDRKIYARNIEGKVTTITFQEYSGSFDFVRRVTFDYIQGQLVSQFEEDYNSGTNEWEFDQSLIVEYTGGYQFPSDLKFTFLYSTMAELIQKVTYTYGANNKPSSLSVSTFDTDFNAWIPSQFWNISDWGPNEFSPDFVYGNNFAPKAKTTDYIIGKESVYDLYPAELTLQSGYDILTETYSTTQRIHSSVYDSENQRTEFYLDNITPTDTLPIFRTSTTYDACYGYDKSLQYDYNGSAYELGSGIEFAGETTPYLNSCYVNAYNRYGSFSVGNPTGTWDKRYEINHVSNLSVDENEVSLFEMYPNPASNYLTIKSNNDEKAHAKIVNLMGEIQLEKELSGKQNEINLSNLPNGVYVIEYISNGSVQTTRFIKQ